MNVKNLNTSAEIPTNINVFQKSKVRWIFRNEDIIIIDYQLKMCTYKPSRDQKAGDTNTIQT